MAKKGKRRHIVLKSKSGHTYHSTKNVQNSSERIVIKKFDPQLGEHTEYKEEK